MAKPYLKKMTVFILNKRKTGKRFLNSYTLRKMTDNQYFYKIV